MLNEKKRNLKMRREMLRLFALTSLVNLLNIQSKKKFFLLSISIAIFLCFLFMFLTISMCIYGDIINETNSYRTTILLCWKLWCSQLVNVCFVSNSYVVVKKNTYTNYLEKWPQMTLNQNFHSNLENVNGKWIHVELVDFKNKKIS